MVSLISVLNKYVQTMWIFQYSDKISFLLFVKNLDLVNLIVYLKRKKKLIALSRYRWKVSLFYQAQWQQLVDANVTRCLLHNLKISIFNRSSKVSD